MSSRWWFRCSPCQFTFGGQLGFDDLLVGLVRVDEFLMCSPTDDLAFIEDDDLVGVSNR